MVLAAGLAAPTATLVLAQPRPGDPLLVVVPPWHDADRILARADLRAAAPVRAPFAVLAAAADAPDAEPSRTIAALRAAGAWAVLGAGALAFICGTSP